MKTNPEIHITTDGKITYAVLKQDGKVLSRSEAKCHPDDKFDFETGAKIALDRLEIKKDIEQPKYSFKVGDIVEFVGDYPPVWRKIVYPPKGTRGEIVHMLLLGPLVKWEKGKVLNDEIWWCAYKDLKKVEQHEDSLKVGDIVEYLMEQGSQKFFPPKGTRGEVIELDTHQSVDPCVLVRWEKGTTQGNGEWWCRVKKLKKVDKFPKYSFKVGDRVRFRSWDDMKREFGVDPRFSTAICIKKDKLYFSGIMSPLCGTYATIKSITYNHRWGLSEVELTNLSSNMVGTKYMPFCTVMLEPALTKKR